MIMNTTAHRASRSGSLLVVLGLAMAVSAAGQETADDKRRELSPYMNAIPPSKDFFCVGTGAANRVLHPDRAPHTELAMQNGVVLFSGSAPQQGVNFILNAGSLVYRNQMTTLGVSDPPPQVGMAGMVQQRPWKATVPWTEARWSQGEDIAWQGIRLNPNWIGGLPHWALASAPGTYPAICPEEYLSGDDAPYSPEVLEAVGGGAFTIGTAISLHLSRGIYQATKIRAGWGDLASEECPYEFREPWFQGRGRYPAFNASAERTPGNSVRLGGKYFPNYLNIYAFQKLELDGGRLVLDFERSATWPREKTPKHWAQPGSQGGARVGTSLAAAVRDEYGNTVFFDRAPAYGWETDYKVPHKAGFHSANDPSFGSLPAAYDPLPNAWRLPHKRLRTVQLFPADSSTTPKWTVAFVYEHPESDRITGSDTGEESNTAVERWKSVYSHRPQSDYELGRLPELNDETTLLTVQVYQGAVNVNGAAFQDDYPVWGSTIGPESAASKTRVGRKLEYYAAGGGLLDYNGDGEPGIKGVDDDGDGEIDEPCGFENGLYCGGPRRDGTNEPGIDCYGRFFGAAGFGTGCEKRTVSKYDDNEDGLVEFVLDGKWHGGIEVDSSRATASDPPGILIDGVDAACPGYCDVDDDGDGLIDENSDGQQAYLAVDSSLCTACQRFLMTGTDSDGCNGGISPPQTHLGTCRNPLYWQGKLDAGSNWICGSDDPPAPCEPMDYFSNWDDDEDGIVDEDGPDNPLLVDLRSIDAIDECASGRHPFMPATVAVGEEPDSALAQLPGDTERMCRPILESADDPWTQQVQYVYSRSNPYWLLAERNAERNPREPAYGTVNFLEKPKYYYFPPFSADVDGSESDSLFYDRDGDGVHDPEDGDVMESQLCANQAQPFPCTIQDSLHDEADALDGPNVHPDCVADPDYRADQRRMLTSTGGDTSVPPAQPGDIHLIKRIVRTRPNLAEPNNYIEQVWLYRYTDHGFVKAIFDPTAVEAIINASDSDGIAQPDDILRYSDTHEVAGRPLISYASEWYTYYTPLPQPDIGTGFLGVPPCYESAPYAGECYDDVVDPENPYDYLIANPCDGQYLWEDADYGTEMHTDPDCSELLRNDCGWCFARNACGYKVERTPSPGCASYVCDCYGGFAKDPTLMRQLGIEGAQPRFRRNMIKTARVRGGDGQTHLYRFDYLGTASSVYADDQRIQSYADPHNIAIVDEMVEQSKCEYDPNGTGCSVEDQRSDFYIYEDDFRLVLDPAQRSPQTYADAERYTATTHYLHVPAKVKTRRVVVMNYYGIALSDRLILTPGYDGTVTTLVDNQQYELVNKRGQTPFLYDPSWVAGLRERGADFVKTAGRVGVQLFGGHEGWYSVLTGLAWGSGGGNLYDQQCKTPDVLDDVPVQRVKPDQLNVVTATQHYGRCPDKTDCTEEEKVRDLPKVEAVYYAPISGNAFAFSDVACGSDCVYDASGMIGSESVCKTTSAASCDCSEEGCYGEDGICFDYLDGVNMRKEAPVEVKHIPTARVSSDDEGDGVTKIHYDYDFHGTLGAEKAVEWKWRWSEKVSVANGGTDGVALDIWYFDKNGRIRVHGYGSGTVQGDLSNRPAPSAPFYIDYFGYDEFGRLSVQIVDFELASLGPALDPGTLTYADLTEGTNLSRLDDSSAPANLITRNIYNDAGMLVSTRTGFTPNGDFIPDPDREGDDAVRTDFRVISNRKITYEDSTGKRQPGWEDEHTYRLEYQYVSGDTKPDPLSTEDPKPQISVDVVNGTTTVDVFDGGGRFVERRVIALAPEWATEAHGLVPNEMIKDFGWHLSLADYTGDHAVSSETFGMNGIESELCGATACTGPGDILLSADPKYPGDGNWPGMIGVDENGEALERSILTLARSYSRYAERASLKPSHEIIYNDFSGVSTNERNQVTRRYSYDLEDRIAREEGSDGSITRILFDPKRRPIKKFRGSNDTCEDWFPGIPQDSLVDLNLDDDMVLTEQRLYNDGDEDCEHSPLPGITGCTTEWNNNFPNNANKLVRTRSFTEDAEACGSAYQASTPSRDTQILYDWRGRPVVVKQVAVGYQGGSVTDPAWASATSTVYDNLDRPLLVATWDSFQIPDVATVELWATQPDDIVTAAILALGPLTLSQTLYDERGRPFERRTYDVGPDGSGIYGNRYTYSRTYRDDLDRAIADVSPSGMIVNQYDSLGRVLETSHWSKEDATSLGNPDMVDGVELTRTTTTYDAFGNVLEQVHYDRVDTTEVGAIDPSPNATANNAVISYTYNWYDKAKRLAATANFGTNDDGNNGFVNGTPPTRGAPPIWTGTSYQFDGVDTFALINRYGYDAAGRRIWSQDPKGRVTRTWHDLLGRTLLVAENWKDTEKFAPTQDTSEFLTPEHSGPIRYTAYHHTRGGLNDMIVALFPATQDAAIIPENIEWGDSDPANDFAATTCSVTDTTVQVTQFLYGAPILNDTDHTTPAVSVAPNLVAEVRYPDPANGGQPSATDRVQYKFTIGGNLAQRTDQRGVVLDYKYEKRGQLTDILATIPPGATDVAQTTTRRRFSYDNQGRLWWAWNYGYGGSLNSEVVFQYDSYGNLEVDSQAHQNPGNSLARNVVYDWEWANPVGASGLLHHNRLTQIAVLPFNTTQASEHTLVKFGYGTTEALINRMTRITDDGGNKILEYTRTGGGRTRQKIWGQNTADQQQVTLDFVGTSNDPSVDRFGRITKQAFKADTTLLHSYLYGYDANGNRTYARIRQQGHNNDESYLYGYDELDRLVYAESGTLNDGVYDQITGTDAKGTAWDLDLLGNWSGGDPYAGSVFEYTPDTTPGRDPNTEPATSFVHHATNARNEITARIENGTSASFLHDQTGSLTDDGEHLYTYDAWNRLDEVARKDTGELIAAYRYDPLGRRIFKIDVKNRDAATGFTPVEHYYYDGNRVVEAYRKVPVGGPLPDRHLLDLACPSGNPPPPPPETEKAIATGSPGDAGLSKSGFRLVKDTPAPAPDDVYQQLKADAAREAAAKAGDANVKNPATNLAAPPPAGELKLFRRFIYGLDYIDEQVAQITPDGDLGYVLQDANYNVVGIARACDGELVRQFRYSPYGELTAVEDGTGATASNAGTWHLFQGLWRDHDTGLDHARNRDYASWLGRLIQADPNQTGLIVANALAMNGQTQAAFAALLPRGQYSDGMSLYQFAGSNPGNSVDPAGRKSYASVMAGVGGALLLAYQAYDVVSGLWDFTKSVTDLVTAKERTLSSYLSVGIAGGFLITDFIGGPIDEIMEGTVAGIRAVDKLRDAKRVGEVASLGNLTRRQVSQALREAGGPEDFLKSLTKEEFDELWTNDKIRNGIGYYFRKNGGDHEWIQVSLLPQIMAREDKHVWLDLISKVRRKIEGPFKETHKSKRFHNDLKKAYRPDMSLEDYFSEMARVAKEWGVCFP